MTDNTYFIGQSLYRFRDYPTGSYCSDEDVPVFGEHHVPGVGIDREEYKVVKLTPQGAWVLHSCYGNFRDFEEIKRCANFVLAGKGKRLCYPCIKDAWESFLIRKRRRAMYLRRQLRYAEAALKTAESTKPPEPLLFSASREF